jgi:replicative DNA helicase
MSKQITQKALEYLDYQLSVIPTKADKHPALHELIPWFTQRMSPEQAQDFFSGANVKGLGIVCGAISGGLEVIDVDTKHDTTGRLWEDFRDLIEGTLPQVWQSLVIAQTQSGGYHLYYRCSSVAGNLKLANKANKEVLIETRGERGYVVAPPSPGYSYLQGDPAQIPTITPQDRQALLSIARSFSEVKDPQEQPRTYTPDTRARTTGDSPFEDYNKRGDVVGLLRSHGWKQVSQTAERINLLRPGDTDSKTSGNFHTGLRLLRVFSSSTGFDPDRAYNPSQVYSLLECNSDHSLAYRRLLENGYGEALGDRSYQPTQIKTEQITVKAISPVNNVNTVITTAGQSLKVEDLQGAIGQQVLITSPGPQAQEEVLRAIEFIQGQEQKKRIYVSQGADEIREYRYQLQAILSKYAAIQDQQGQLSDRDTDGLLDEVVTLGARLEPLDRDVFKTEFLALEAIQLLGISEESLSITTDRLTSTRDREAQSQKLSKLLTQAHSLHDKGENEKALELLEGRVREVKLQNKATEFSKLLLPTSEAQIKAEEASLPESLDSGFRIGEEELLLPGGAISVYAAPTNHGKTVLLINTVLNVAQRYPDKRFVFFTYEERETAILQYFLNTYIDLDLNSSKKTNRRILREYFRTGSTAFISKKNLPYFEQKKAEFFQTYIQTGRILVKYVDYNSEELNTAIEYLIKQAPDIGGIFIDYFQLLRLPKEKNSRQEELKQICLSLKDTAVRTGLPIVLAAQFNREVTNLQRLHPTNIGEAGDIERIVNTLIGAWDMSKKPVLKGINEAEADEINRKLKARKLKTEAGNMYLEILKSRDLGTGSFEFLAYNGNTGRVTNRGASSTEEPEYL